MFPFALVHKISCMAELPSWPAELPDAAHDFLRQCLSKDAKLRPTAAQMLAHRFVQPDD